MKKYSTRLLFSSFLLFSLNSIAQTEDLFNESVPVQEFVTAQPELELNITEAESAGNIVNKANKKALQSSQYPSNLDKVGPAGPATEIVNESNQEATETPHPFDQNPILPPASAPFPNMETNPIFANPPPDVAEDASENTLTTETSEARTATPLTALPFEEQQGETTSITQDFAGGINEDMFTKCAILVGGVCSKATNDEGFGKCITRLKQQPACEQFMTFAAKSSFGLNDDVDFVQYFKEGHLTLVHVTRMGQNYPGDYYAIGDDGSFLNITGGKQIRTVNITKDLRYPQITARYPKAQIWSSVEQLPMESPSPSGGLRLIFRFDLLNGCATCDKAGYANVAYDFLATGALQSVSLLSLDPIVPQQ